jgi:DNA-binding HxlR family transcriptional regulator
MGHKGRSVSVPEVQALMQSICDKWALFILHQLARGVHRHGELHRAIPGISPKMLTQTLRALERDQLVKRTVHPVVPPRVEYSLTRLGGTLSVHLEALYRWAERHGKTIHRARCATPGQPDQGSSRT